MIRRKWAVVEDLPPFGVRIDKRYWFKWRATLRVQFDPYLSVETVETAKERDREMVKKALRRFDVDGG